MRCYRFSVRSLKNLHGVDHRLVLTAVRALSISDQDFSVIEGLRTIERQRELVERGTSKTMNSYHLTGHAIDVVPYPLDWNERHPSWDRVARAMRLAANDLGLRVYNGWEMWGWDRPHWQVPRD